MTTELAIVQHGASLTEQVEYARFVAEASLLPDSYRKKPANVLIAVGLGQAMGLSPAESLWRIDVIGGKPAAAAELIAANVRKAGHKLRVRVTEDPPSATCTIIRADDPEPVVITRDMAWAQRMGLTGKDNYKKQPATMLSWRAISACARLACSEALYGVGYTPDELQDMPGLTVVQEPESRLRAALSERPASEPDVAAKGGQVDHPAPSDDRDHKGQRNAMFAAFRDAGFTDARTEKGRADRLDYCAQVIGHAVESTNDMTWDERGAVIDALKADTQAMEAESLPDPSDPGDPWKDGAA